MAEVSPQSSAAIMANVSHSAGYGQGQGSQDLSGIINGNNGSFVGVVIQYRVGCL